ncbi:hypothetical protein AMTR_s00778p00006010 [Amborella trichopoda]|uniref:Uncharacterized protein n=1 Tax=Amborella trichopoda TaxID=13333 RepID=W1NF72_AMBTC|nr:hypothetical protein AMTR_s00778p00006010 [Amborella trichopoda]
MGNLSSNYKKRNINYCKEVGHLITECRIRPKHKAPPRAYAAVTTIAEMTNTLTPPFTLPTPIFPNSPSQSLPLTPEFLQQVIQILHVSGFGKADLKNSWVLDFGALNHITNNLTFLKYVVPYKSTQNIHIANGQSLQVSKVGSLL